MNKIKILLASAAGAIAGFAGIVAAHATTLVTFDSATTTFANAASWSSEVFDDFKIIIAVAVGVVVGALFVVWIVRQLVKAGKMVLSRRGGRRGRRR